MTIRETSPPGQDSYRVGDYWMICDVCGFKYRRSDMKERWDHAWVCHEDWEPQHPQEGVRGIADKIRVPVARPDPEPIMITTPVKPEDL